MSGVDVNTEHETATLRLTKALFLNAGNCVPVLLVLIPGQAQRDGSNADISLGFLGRHLGGFHTSPGLGQH
jgi:hypothetical protein